MVAMFANTGNGSMVIAISIPSPRSMMPGFAITIATKIAAIAVRIFIFHFTSFF